MAPSEEKPCITHSKGSFNFEWITPATRFECIVDVTDQGAQRIETEEHRKAVSVSLGTPC